MKWESHPHSAQPASESLNIFWPQTLYSKDLPVQCEQEDVQSLEQSWSGRRTGSEREEDQELPGRRAVEAEMSSWGTVQRLVSGCEKWRKRVAGLQDSIGRTGRWLLGWPLSKGHGWMNRTHTHTQSRFRGKNGQRCNCETNFAHAQNTYKYCIKLPSGYVYKMWIKHKGTSGLDLSSLPEMSHYVRGKYS